MNFIFKHIVSKSNKFGYDCLIESVGRIRNLYPNSKSFILYNNLENNIIDELEFKLRKQKVDFINQQTHADSIKIHPNDSAWKFYPPRIDINSYEIIIDNDLLIYKKSKFIDEFLNSDKIIVTSAHKRFYGQFDHLIQNGILVNSGLFGFPPKYDFKKEIDDFIQKENLKEWKTHFCEEGLITYLMLKHGKYIIVDMDDIRALNKDYNKKYYANSGYHFTGLNNGFNYYWLKWKTKIL